MKNLLLTLFLLLLISPAYAEQQEHRAEIDDYRIFYDNVWINAPEDFNANLLITGNRFKLSFNDTYPINPYNWDIYSSKHAELSDISTIFYGTIIADEFSSGYYADGIVINASSTNSLITARGIAAGGFGLEAIGGSFLSIGQNSMPAYFYTPDGRGVVVNCDLEVTGQIINPQLEELERRITQLENKLK